MSRIRLPKTIKGFTIIELVAVIVVLGVCLAPIGTMFYTVMAKYTEPEAIQVAAALAEQEMERVTGLRFSDLANDGPAATDFTNYTYQIIVSAVPVGLANDPAMNEYKQVEVRVTNSSIGVAVSLITIVTIKENVS